ncbi:hypothetical protein NBRC116594_04960 [Shimia sp. NS0008-38b]|uniref:sulfotransferase family protein n=1 Tax=Shimia sp. NS0008-38b TaxID=3127653 RepID=UPI00310C3083
MSHRPDLSVMFGSLRSGTTMVRLMLDGHPRLIAPGETDFLTDHLRRNRAGDWQYDLASLAADRMFQAMDIPVPQSTDAATAFAELCVSLRRGQTRPLVLIAHRGLDRLLDLVPDIPVIHLVRDPRDVARSAIGMGWAGNTYHGARTWLETELEWEQTVHRLNSDQHLDLRYEQLVHAPEHNLKEMCAFLGETFEPAMLDYTINSTYARPDPALTEQWRHKQTPRELGLIEPLFGELLSQRGYAFSGHPHLHPGPFGRLALRLDHLRSVWSRRIARYGVWDPIYVRLCERLGLQAWARPAQRRMDVITQDYLK